MYFLKALINMLTYFLCKFFDSALRLLPFPLPLLPHPKAACGEYIIIGIIVVVAEGVTRLREVPWHRRGKENRTNKKPVIQAVY